MAWYNESWTKRVKVTVDYTKVDATLSNFPIYIDLSELPADFHTNCNQTDARDIRVTTSDEETEIPREVVSYNNSTDTGELHFKAPSLSSSANTEFYIYYGNASATEPAVDSTYGRNNVWSDYKAVYHMKENPTGSVTDSTGNTPFNANVDLDSDDLTTGKIGAGIKKDTGEYFRNTTGISFSSGNDVTFQAWLYMTGKGAGANPGIWRAGNTSTGTEAFNILNGTTRRPWIRWATTDILKPTTGYQIPEDAWTLMHWVVDSGSSVNFYANGSSEHSASHSKITSAFTINNFGWQYSTTEEVLGTYDEVRFRASILSSDWISTEYNNQSTPNTFSTIGTAESQPSSGDNSERGLYVEGYITSSSERGLYLEGASAPVEGWYNSSWSYRVKITVQSSEIDSTLSNFPVYVNLANLPSGFHANVNQTDARDIRVTRSDGETECAREVVSYDSATDTGELHFKADSISSSANTDFYIYYGNSSASDYATNATYGAENVWTNYKLVYHGSSTSDSSSNGNDLSSQTVGYSTTSTVNLSSSDKVTISYWADDVTSTGTQIIYEMSTNYNSQSDSFVSYIDSGNIDVSTKGNVGYNLRRSSINTTSKYYQTDVLDTSADGAGEITTYEDASVKTTTLTHSSNNTNNFGNKTMYFGGRGGSAFGFSGSMEDIRVYEGARSSDWIESEYDNQSSPSTFYEVGTQEEPSAGTEANSERGLYIEGYAESNATRGLYLEGVGIDANSERGLYISGISTGSSERTLYVSGSQTLSTSYFNIEFGLAEEANSEKGLYIEGSDAGNSERGIYIQGKELATSERSLYTQGKQTNYTEHGMYLWGSERDSKEVELYIWGSNTLIGERGLRIEGAGGGNSERNLRIKGMDTATSERNLYVQGKLENNSERDFYLEGVAYGESERKLYTYGKISTDSERGLYISGRINEDSERGLYLWGGESIASEKGLYIEGQSVVDERGLYLEGFDTGSSERSLYIQGQLSSSSERSLYILGSNEGNLERDLYIRGINTSQSERNIYTQGKILEDSERGLHIFGGSPGDSERPLYLEGKISTNSERQLYIYGIGTDNSERILYIQGSNTGDSERTLYTEGCIQSNSERGVYIWGIDTAEEDRSIWIKGSTWDSRGLYIIGNYPEWSDTTSTNTVSLTDETVESSASWVDKTVEYGTIYSNETISEASSWEDKTASGTSNFTRRV